MLYQRRNQKVRPVARDCPFCHQKSEPDYKEINIISRYLSERGKLLPQTRTGLCSFHQRKVTQEVKRARHVALLPFVVRA
ncbi:TPA: 30S ribosomal protein S18 [Patescibacteria group bacterium]|nr:30S ribosomal protein S18 [Patescibacteria group bacterium]